MVTLTYDGKYLTVSTSAGEFAGFPVADMLLAQGFEKGGSGQFRSSVNVALAADFVRRICSSWNYHFSVDAGVNDLADSLAAERRLVATIRAGEITCGPRKSINFKRQLYTYQLPALEHAASVQNPANFSVPGSGKTTIAYGYFQLLREQNVVDSLLVVCPISAFHVWEEEAHECLTDARVARINGTARRGYYGDKRYNVLLINYHLLYQDTEEIINHIRETGRYLIVADESHYVKNPGEGAIKRALLEIGQHAVRRMITTGTPCPNSLLDLQSQFAFLWPSEAVTGSKHEFENLVNTAAVDDVNQLLRPFFYRIRKQELGLPDPLTQEVFVKMGSLQRQIYDAVRERALSHLERFSPHDLQLVGWQRAWVMRLNQIMSNPSLLAEDAEEFEPDYRPPIDAHVVELANDYHKYELPAKLVRTLEIVNELRTSGVTKVVVWTNFKKNVGMLGKLLEEAKWTVHIVTGDVTSDQSDLDGRDARIEEFRHSNVPSILLATPASCAEAISLHKHCHHMVFVDLTFNAVHWMQAKDRIHRIGMDRDVETNYYVMLTEDSYDEEIYRRVLQKEDRMNAVLASDLIYPDDGGDIVVEDMFTPVEEALKDIDAELQAWREFDV